MVELLPLTTRQAPALEAVPDQPVTPQVPSRTPSLLPLTGGMPKNDLTPIVKQRLPDPQEATERVEEIEASTVGAPRTRASLATRPDLETHAEALGILERTIASFTRGTLIDELGAAGTALRRDPTPEQQLEVDSVQARLAALPDGAGYGQVLVSASEVVGQMYSSIVSKEAAEAVAAGAVVGALAGTLGGPLAPITSGVGAAVGAGAGFISHLITHAYQTEGGNAYVDMRDAGITHDTSALASNVVGVVNAGLEIVGAAAVMKPVSEAGKRLLKKAIQKAAQDPQVLSILGGFVKDTGLAITGETLTEGMQEVVNIAAEEWAKEVEDIEGSTAEEMEERVLGVMIKTAQAMVLLGPLGSSVNVVTKTAEAKRAKRDAKERDKIAQQVQELSELPPAVVTEQVTAMALEAGVPNMYVDPVVLNELMPAQVLEEMNLAEAINEARVTGTAVEIPIETWVAHILIPEEGQRYETLKDHAKEREEGMSLAEQEQWDEDGLQDEIDYAQQVEEMLATDEVIVEITDAGDRVQEEGDLQVEPVVEIELPVPADSQAAAEIQGVVELGMNLLQEELDIATGDTTAALKRAIREQVVDPENTAVTVAENEVGLRAVISDLGDVGMTPKQKETYLAKQVRAAERPRKRVQDKVLKQQQRENRAEWKREEQAVKEQIRETLANSPPYAALNSLGADRLDRAAMEQLVQDIAIDEEAVFTNEAGLVIWPIAGRAREGVRAVTKELMVGLPKSEGRAIVTPKGTKGIDPQLHAEVHGYANPQEMVLDFITAPKFERALDAATRDIMNQRHGNLLEEGQRIQLAREELAKDDVAEMIEFELLLIQEAAGQKRTAVKLVRQAAKALIEKKQIKDITPHKFELAAGQAARAAAKALRNGDLTAAAEAKYQQVLAHHMTKEAYKVQRQVEAGRKFANQQSRGRNSLASGNSFQLAINDVLGKINLRALPLGPKQMTRLQAKVTDPRSNVRKRAAAAKVLFNEKTLTPWRNLTLEEFNSVIATVRELHHQGVTENKLLDEQQKAELDELVEELNTRLDTTLGNPKRKRGWDQNTWDRVKNHSLELRMTITHVDSLLRELDGFKEGGVWLTNIKGRVDRALSVGYREEQRGYLRRHKQVGEDIVKLWEKLPESKKRRFNTKEVKVPGTEIALTHHQRIAAMLNMGNEGNIEALKDSGTFTAEEIQAIQDHASEADWEFVQSVWDYLQTYWGEIAESENRRRKDTPKQVQAVPIKTKFGTRAGGYYPISYDKSESIQVTAESIEQLENDVIFGNATYGHTAEGHKQARTDGAGQGRTVRLDTFTINTHLDQVIYDLEMGDAVRDIRKILYNPEVKLAFVQHGKKAMWDTLDAWLRDAITQEMGPRHVVDRALKHIRTGTTVAAISLSPAIALLQPLGVLQSGVHLGHRNMARSIAHVLTNFKQARKEAIELSGFMATRDQTWNKDRLDAAKASRPKGPVGRIWQKMTTEWFFWAMKTLQGYVDLATWHAGFKRAAEKRPGEIDRPGDLDKAIAAGDSAVRTTQGSGIFSDRSSFERGRLTARGEQQEVLRGFTLLQSYFIAKWNVFYELGGRFIGGRKTLMKVMGLATNVFILFTLEQMIAEMIRGRGPDEDEDESVFAWAAQETGSNVLNMFPVVREVGSAYQGFATGGPVGGMADALARVAKQGAQGEIDEAFLKSLNNVGGVGLKYPSRQINKTAGAVLAARRGEDVSVREYFMGLDWKD